MSRNLRYTVDFDVSNAPQAAAQVRRAWERELGRVQIGAGLGGPAASSGRTVRAGAGSAGLGSVGGLLAGGIAGYSAMELTRMGYQAGKLGAANLQLANSYKELAAAVGLSGEALTERLSGAVKQTVSEQTLMAETNRLLLTAQNEQIDVTEEQIETLARFARLRARQLPGLTTEEAYTRLLTGITKRETELLDELGLSTKGLAAQLGKDIDDINNSVESLMDAIVQAADMELDLGGDVALSEAEKIQRAEVRIQDAINRLRLAAADPVVFTIEAVADVTEGVVGSGQGMSNALRAGPNPLAGRRDQLVAQAASFAGTPGRNSEAQRLADDVQLVEEALARLNRAQLVAQGAIRQLDLSKFEEVERIEEMRVALNAVGDAYVELQSLGAAGLIDPGILAQANAEWYNIVNGIEQGTVETGEAVQRSGDLVDSLRDALGVFGFMIPQASDFADELGRAADNAAAVSQNFAYSERLQLYEDNPYLRSLAQMGALGTSMMTPEAAARRPNRLGEQMQAEREQQAMLRDALEKRQAEQERLHERQLRSVRSIEDEWQRTARRVADAFEDQFESMARNVPGLFGTSSVTGEQMNLAAAGLPQNFADDYLRRLTDEVVNGVDWAGVDIGDAAARAGIAPGLDPRQQLGLFRQSWESGALFADPSNLELINMDAVRASFEQQAAAATGQANLMDFLKGQGMQVGDAGTNVGQSLKDSALKAFEAGGYVDSLKSGFETDMSENFGVLEPTLRRLGQKANDVIGEELGAGSWMGTIVANVLEALANDL